MGCGGERDDMGEGGVDGVRGEVLVAGEEGGREMRERGVEVGREGRGGGGGDDLGRIRQQATCWPWRVAGGKGRGLGRGRGRGRGKGGVRGLGGERGGGECPAGRGRAGEVDGGGRLERPCGEEAGGQSLPEGAGGDAPHGSGWVTGNGGNQMDNGFIH